MLLQQIIGQGEDVLVERGARVDDVSEYSNPS